jgi:hypothetical protein
MKTLKLLMLLLAIAMLFSTCKKDDDNDEIIETGILTIGADEYNLNHGELLGISEIVAGQLYDGYVYLLSSDYTYGSSTITGTGQVVELDIFFNSANEIVPGTYTFAANEPYTAGTFIANFYTDFNMATFGVSALYVPATGTLTVSKSGSVYELNLDVLANKYAITHADDEPIGDPVAQNIPITFTCKGDLIQKYLGK